jgi:hypothetical protein
MDNLSQESEQVDWYYEHLRQSLNLHARYEIDKRFIQDFIITQWEVVQALRRLARHRCLRSDTEAGRRIRQLRTTILQELEVLEIAFSHLNSAHRRVEPRFIEGIINPDSQNSGTSRQRNVALRMLREFETHYAVVNGQWGILLGHMPEVQHFADMDLR